MADNKQFTYAESSIDGVTRSTFNFNHRVQLSAFHGDLIPLEITEVLPGDSFNYNINSFVRMTTPIAPIMDNIYLNVAAFYVPKRLVWNKTKQFYGENTEGYGIQTEILEPRIVAPQAWKLASSVPESTFCDYFGLIQNTPNLVAAPVNVNLVYSFYQVYNDWFRNENFMAPYLWNHDRIGDFTDMYLTLDGQSVNLNNVLSIPKVCKQMDIFTSCLPWSQKSASAVLLPLGDQAPVRLLDTALGTGDPSFRITSGSNDLQLTNGTGPLNSLVADLGQATAANVNQLRMAVQLQRVYEALARCGSKYREYIKGIFGVNIGDTTAQMAEYLGGVSIRLNVAQVLQTTGYAAGQASKLGAPGAVSTTLDKDSSLFTKSFTEPGYLVIVAYTKHDRSYGQGVEPAVFKHDIWSYYNPKFAHLPEQAVKTSSLYFDGSNVDEAFGFNEAWSSDYRFKPDRVAGFLNPSRANSLNFWNLAENFTRKPVLGKDFLIEDRSAINRATTTDVCDYLMDFFFEAKVSREMPVHSIPGLLDHF